MKQEFMQDKWIKGYEGVYTVSKDGVVYNHRIDREISQHIASGGAKRVCFGRSKYYVHRLVASAYIPNPDGKSQVDHIDGDRSNNSVDNLRWCTNAENQDFRQKQGNSGAEYHNTGKSVIYNDVIYPSIKGLARELSYVRGSKVDTIVKQIKKARYGEIVLYGKKLRFI